MKNLKWIALGVGIAALGAVYLNRDTLRIFGDQMAAKRRSDERMRAAEAERAKLVDKCAALDSPVGQERQAREQGYTRPGERPLFGP